MLNINLFQVHLEIFSILTAQVTQLVVMDLRHRHGVVQVLNRSDHPSEVQNLDRQNQGQDVVHFRHRDQDDVLFHRQD